MSISLLLLRTFIRCGTLILAHFFLRSIQLPSYFGTMASKATATPQSAAMTPSKGTSPESASSQRATTTPPPPISRPVVLAPSNSPPTPTNYEIMTESCDWCLADTPWDDADLFSSESFGLSQASGTTQSTPPPTKHDASQVNLRPRQDLDIPMM